MVSIWDWTVFAHMGIDEMDKQTAIDLLDNLLGMIEDNHESDYDTAIKMGIDALQSNAPNVLSVLDCVERQAAVDAIRAKDDYSNVAVALGLGKAITAICELPSVQPQQVTGKLNPEQPEIIRCEECRYYTAKTHKCEPLGLITCDGFWCKQAERREAANDD